MHSTLRLWPACCAVALMSGAFAVHAQPYPHKSIRLIVPYAAGGSTDALARAIGQKLGETFGQQVIIDNRTGANGNIGTDMVAKANPDGYTILMAFDATMVINPAAYSKLPFDPVKDFAPITKVAALPLILVAHPSFPPSNTKELIPYAKSKPGLNYSSSGHARKIWTASHLWTSRDSARKNRTRFPTRLRNWPKKWPTPSSPAERANTLISPMWLKI